MAIGVLHRMNPDQVFDAVGGFSSEYVRDWTQWMSASQTRRPFLFGLTLRKWQAVRPLRMRRLRDEADHDPPYLDDLISEAEPYLRDLADMDVRRISEASPTNLKSLKALWDVFSMLPVNGSASCVGISKAVLLLTEGRIGPALDSRVRSNLGIDRVHTAEAWIKVLRFISADITAFEVRHGRSLQLVVPPPFSHLQVGRLYDMALGPR